MRLLRGNCTDAAPKTTERKLALVFLIIVSCTLILSFGSPLSRNLMSGRRVNVLLFGLDNVTGQHHTDTIMLASFEPVTRKMDLLSIPRDTIVPFYPYKNHRINEIFAYHERTTKNLDSAAGHLIETVTTLLSSGTSTVNVPYYAAINYDGFAETVDLLGGITLKAYEHMRYVDRAGRYAIDLTSGTHHLNGKQALNYVRYRGDSGDRGRILRQHDFVRELIKKCSEPALAFRIPAITGTIYASLHTNMTILDILNLTLESRQLTLENLRVRLLPGENYRNYWRSDKKWTAFIHRQLSAKPAVEEKVNLTFFPSEKITVKVWNATKKKGLAQTTSERLTENGFDVIEWGDYNSRQYRTIVIDRIGDMTAAWAVAKSLGVEAVMSELKPETYTNCEVILGEDAVKGSDLKTTN